MRKKSENLDHFAKLPSDIQKLVFSWLDTGSLQKISLVSKTFNKLVKEMNTSQNRKIDSLPDIKMIKEKNFEKTLWKSLGETFAKSASKLLNATIEKIEISNDGIIKLSLPYDENKLARKMAVAEARAKEEVDNVNKVLSSKYAHMVPAYTKEGETHKLVILTDDSQLLQHLGLKIIHMPLQKVTPVKHKKMEQSIAATAAMLLTSGLSQKEAKDKNKIPDAHLSKDGLYLEFSDDNYARNLRNSLLAAGVASASLKQTGNVEQPKWTVRIKDHHDIKNFLEQFCGFDSKFTKEFYHSNKLDDMHIAETKSSTPAK